MVLFAQLAGMEMPPCPPQHPPHKSRAAVEKIVSDPQLVCEGDGGGGSPTHSLEAEVHSSKRATNISPSLWPVSLGHPPCLAQPTQSRGEPVSIFDGTCSPHHEGPCGNGAGGRFPGEVVDQEKGS